MNTTVHSYSAVLGIQLFARALGSRARFSATSVDQLPHMLAALQMFGNQLLMPVPDVDRTDLFICLGANPLASNGSMMTAPDIAGRLKAIRAARRQGDRARSAAHRDRRERGSAPVHPPGHRRGAAARDDPRRVRRASSRPRRARSPTGSTSCAQAAARWTPERVAQRSPASRPTTSASSRARFATTPRAVLLRPHRRVHAGVRRARGVAVLRDQRADRPPRQQGGLMFTTPAVDPVPLAARMGERRLRALAQPRARASPSSAASCRWPCSPRRSRRRARGRSAR